MSTPMFIREPIAGNDVQATNAVEGQALTVPFAAPNAILIQPVAEATLVEELRYGMRTVNTDAGKLFLYLDYVDSGAVLLGYHLIGVYDIAAGTAAQPSTGTISINLTLPVGARLACTHNVQENGGGAQAFMSILALGGILR